MVDDLQVLVAYTVHTHVIDGDSSSFKTEGNEKLYGRNVHVVKKTDTTYE